MKLRLDNLGFIILEQYELVDTGGYYPLLLIGLDLDWYRLEEVEFYCLNDLKEYCSNDLTLRGVEEDDLNNVVKNMKVSFVIDIEELLIEGKGCNFTPMLRMDLEMLAEPIIFYQKIYLPDKEYIIRKVLENESIKKIIEEFCWKKLLFKKWGKKV